jgi:Flp pilus assembly protein TadD
MSIVDDALQALEKSGRAAAASTDLPGSPGLAAQTVAHELYAGGRPVRRRTPWPLLGTVALLMLGGGTWWLLERTAARLPPAPLASQGVVALVKASAAVASIPVPARPVIQAAPTPALLLAPSSTPLAGAPLAVTTESAPSAAHPSAPPLPMPARVATSVASVGSVQAKAAKPAMSADSQITPNPSVQAAEPPPAIARSAAGPSVDMALSVDNRAPRALDALSRGDLRVAMQLAEQLIAVAPGRWEGHYVMGSALLSSGRVGEAEAALGQALVLQPNSASVLLQAGMAAQEAGQTTKARSLLRRASGLAPDNVAVWLNLGYSADLAGVRDEAEAAYQRYLQLTNGHSGAESQRVYVSERLQFLGKR